MTLDASHRVIAAQLLLVKSDSNMEQAIKNAELGYWDVVANRLYYAVFHAVNAMLVIDGIRTGTHKGTSVQFGKSYVLTGKFDRQDGMMYSRLQTMREKADYNNVFKLNETEGRQLIESAERLRTKICDCVRLKIDNIQGLGRATGICR